MSIPFRHAYLAGLMICGAVLPLIACVSGCRTIRSRVESKQSISAKRLARRGIEAMHRNQWKDAEELFASALELNPSDDRANWGYAQTLWHHGEREKAIPYMQSAVRQSGSHPELLVRLGRMHLTLGNLTEAEKHCDEALTVGRSLASVWALRGDCLNRREKTTEALAAYHRALALQANYPEVQVEVAELYRRQGRHGRLLATLDRLQDSTLREDLPARVYLLRGIAMRHLGRPGEASSCLADASKLAPQDLNVRLEQASLALATGDVDGAQVAIDNASRLAADSPQSDEIDRKIEEHRLHLAEKIQAEARLR